MEKIHAVSGSGGVHFRHPSIRGKGSMDDVVFTRVLLALGDGLFEGAKGQMYLSLDGRTPEGREVLAMRI